MPIDLRDALTRLTTVERGVGASSYGRSTGIVGASGRETRREPMRDQDTFLLADQALQTAIEQISATTSGL